MYDVLMPIDSDEERAMGQARAISELPAVRDQITVTLLHVFDDESVAENTSPTQITAGRNVQEWFRDRGITVETMSTSGDPSSEILDAASRIGADQIVLGGRKRSPLGSLLFGSVSQAVMLDSEIPVTITGGLDERTQPTHRCPSCGEEYYGDPGTEIATCRSCGGSKVEAVDA
ncbi:MULTISPECIES: universal stress protein [Halomicrobium]|uniref:UspA domain protein n=2 Tax=Halomicrobium mukohataei TaxID=57705 RepID=C7P198_HALMD|nr:MULTISPECIES: universal stress protein [Halomicrobium]ACV47106.1 UspA domain protein [Halomicrobium mukohataei DSM 12286]QCD65589.1 universal stress protein [Halomicrobium mukohataei]QFR20395.1 universal stress protein [Halomicrobium sp. ZPS1]